jgi:hypothetical protein
LIEKANGSGNNLGLQANPELSEKDLENAGMVKNFFVVAAIFFL